ncbi:MAG: PRC-barrel domain-containing protein [Actinomycetota bacterium]|nr:PRC-barrel domain-containing protein [Actinomycetota bacterium]
MGTRVMSKASAERVAKLERVVFDAPPRRVLAVQVGKRFVDWSAVSGLGTDAVVIESEEHLRPAADAREERALGGDLDWKGKRVLSDHGNEVGTVTEIELDENTGAIEVVETTSGRVSADRLLALGSYCLVVRQEPPPPASA